MTRLNDCLSDVDQNLQRAEQCDDMAAAAVYVAAAQVQATMALVFVSLGDRV